MPRRRSLVCLAAALLPALCTLAGCEGATPDPGPTAVERQGAPLVASEPGGGLRVDLALERQLKAAHAGPLTVVRPPDREDFEASPRAESAEGLAPAARETLLAADLPVLVPDEPELLGSARATSGEAWYALAMSAEGYGVYLHATRAAQRLAVPLEEPVALPTREVPRVTFNEGSPVLSFVAHGVSYSLFVECEAPHTDPRCTEATFVRGLADSLRRFDGGAP
jgi:hypothetical protein